MVVSGGHGPTGPESLVMGDFTERLALAVPASLLLVGDRDWGDDPPPAPAPPASVDRAAPPVGVGA